MPCLLTKYNEEELLKLAAEKKLMAAILVRGLINVKGDIKDTIQNLGMFRKNYCVLVENDPVYVGMLKKAKDFITYGEIDEETLKLLLEKRGQDYKKGKRFFRLAPPRKGFERKGIKKPFSVGGALGYRGSKINDLIRRMV